MAAPHFHPGLNHGGPRHVCMMESYDPEVTQSTMGFSKLVEENKRYADEVARLKALLAENNISIPVSPSAKVAINRKQRRSLRLCNKNGVLALEEDSKPLPELPTEILLRILSYAVTSSTPLIDPFYKLRKENVTKAERLFRRKINVNFLATSKAFNVDGNKLIVENNELIFTQAAALENFAKVPGALRANMPNITIRCVGRYYFDRQKKLDLDGDTIYHESVPRFTIPTLARPLGLMNDGGVQAYCWYQVADLLKGLQLPFDPVTKLRPKLFPGLKSLRMDLVNFCDHLPLGIWGFASVVRWHLGAICDELLVTGIPELEGGSDEEMLLRNLLRDEGLISTGCPVFISGSSGLRPLEGHGYCQRVVRAAKQNPFRSRAAVTNPAGASPPASSHATGTTIWKWTSDHTNRPKTWIEFDRETGYPVDELEPHMDMSDNDDDDENEDEDEDDWDDENDDEDYDSDDDMFGHDGMLGNLPALASLLAFSQSFPHDVQGPLGSGSDSASDSDEMPGLLGQDGVEIFGDMPDLVRRDNDQIPDSDEMPGLVEYNGGDISKDMPDLVPLESERSDMDSVD